MTRTRYSPNSMAIEFYDASQLPNPDVVWAFHVLVTARGWQPSLTTHAVLAANDVTPAQPNRSLALLHAAERIGRAVHEIESEKGYVPSSAAPRG